MRGIWQWKKHIFELVMACQEQTSDFILKQKMGNKYYMIDRTLSPEQNKVVGLDKAEPGATKTLLGLAKSTFQKEISNPVSLMVVRCFSIIAAVIKQLHWTARVEWSVPISFQQMVFGCNSEIPMLHHPTMMEMLSLP